MSSKEQPTYLPVLPEPRPRPADLVPDMIVAPVGESGPRPTKATGVLYQAETAGVVPLTEDELLAAIIGDIDGVEATLTALPPPPVESRATESPPPPSRESKEQERVQLAGRLGQNPTIRVTPKGTLVAKFPLGVKDNPDIEQTTWHTVLAFQKRAEQARDQLTKGDVVEVIGYRHQRDLPGRNGPRTVEEIYATVLKKR